MTQANVLFLVGATIFFVFAQAMLMPPPSRIPRRCLQNETMKTCGTRCEPSCDNRNPMCTMECVMNVCQCNAGYLRNRNRRCVLPIDCNGQTRPKRSDAIAAPGNCNGQLCPEGWTCRSPIQCIRAPCPGSEPRCMPPRIQRSVEDVNGDISDVVDTSNEGQQGM